MSSAHLPRLRAPGRHGELLVVPPPDAIPQLLRHNQDILAGGDLLGRPLVEIRHAARRDVLAVARRYLDTAGEPTPDASGPVWFVGGHQPELFHPGVWVKNFLLQSLARRHGGVALNLVVDSDLVKATSLRIPAGDRVVTIPFDEPAGRIPFEEAVVGSESLFDSFPGRVRPYSQAWPFHPWLNDVWAEMRRAAQTTVLLGERIVRTRRALERSMGRTPLEAPLSAVCATESFAWFAAAILADLPRFAEDYNTAVRDYRRRHGIENASHPVPDLARRDDAIETPFWTWHPGESRRRPLFAARTAEGVQLFAERTPIATLPGGPLEWVDAWAALEASDVKIRTRALTTTLFSRLLLADAFVHGIGGGKYDEVTDDLFTRFFGLAAPKYLVATATLLLPFPRGAADGVAELHRLERDLWFNPQRHAIGVAELIAAKDAARAMPETTHEERVARFHRLLETTANLRPHIADSLEVAKRKRLDAEVAQKQRGVESSREYAFCLYPEDMLREFMATV